MSLPKYNYPHLDLPDAIEHLTFEAIKKVLQNDQRLSAVVKTWVVWDGSITDVTEPTFAYCPYLKLSPFPSESHWVTEGQHEGPLVIRVQMAVQGTRFQEIVNLWNAMRLAIFPQVSVAAADAIRGQLMAAGVLKPTITLSAYGITDEDKDGNRLLVADGTVSFNIHIGT